MYPVRIIYFYEGADTEDAFYRSLVDRKVYNIITSSSAEEIAAEFGQCMSGRTEEEARTGKRETVPASRKQYRASGLNIAVFGAEAKSGATYLAFGLAAFLSGAGLRTGYAEVAEKPRAALLPPTPAEVLTNTTDAGLDVNVVDFGIIDQKKINMSDRFGKFILCSGWQPWQEKTLAEAVFKITRTGHRIDLVFFPAPDTVRPRLLAKYTSKTVTVHFAEFTPDLGSQPANKGLFEALFKEWEV